MITRELVKYAVTGRFRQVRVVENIITIENGALVEHKLNHSRVIHPGDDYSGETDVVRALCEDLHTPDAVALYEAYMTAQEEAQE